MNDSARIKLSTTFEKRWWQSKKFVAFLLMELLLSGMAIVALLSQPQLGWPLAAYMLGVVVTMGCTALVFNGYQAKLDMYIRGMALTGRAPRSLEKLFINNDKEIENELPDDGEA